MILKVLAILAALFIVYLIFFKKNRESEVQGNHKTAKKDKIEDVMEECPSCGTYISKKEAILSNGRFYCSKECLK